MTQFGLTANSGFVPMQQADIVTDLTQALQAQFGNSVSTAPETVFGQIVAIMSERLASLWQLAEAVHANQTLQGASGLDVDNLLALASLTRLPASATRTNPTSSVQTNGVPLYGLVLYGAPGTVVPAGSLIDNGQAGAQTFALDAAVTIAGAQNGVQQLVFSGAPTAGTYALTLTAPDGEQLTTPAIPYNAMAATTQLRWAHPPSGGTYTLRLGSQTTAAIAYNATATQVQTAIGALSGYQAVAVTGSAAAGFQLIWGTRYAPTVVVAGAAAPSVIDAVQAVIGALTAADGVTQPFTDVAATPLPYGIQLAFGAFPPQSGQAATAAMPQPEMLIAANGLTAGATAINLSVAQTVVGAPAQGVGAATATATGPVAVTAGQLTTIVTPVLGWTGVINQLDCLTGADVETDAAAIGRLQTLRGGQGAANLAAIVQKVEAVAGVTTALGFQNATNAAQQVVIFAQAPTAGTYQLSLAGETTAAIAATAAAADVQAAVRALPGFQAATVTGSVTAGFVVDFTGVAGNQGQPLLQIAANSTGVAISPAFGRPAHSIEVVANGGADADVAQAIFSALPAGIGTYGAPVATTTGSVSAGSTELTVADASNIEVGLAASMQGLQSGTQVAAVSETTVTLTQAALANINGQAVVFDRRQTITDAMTGTAQVVAFSRPSQLLLYVQLALTTDTYTTPGVPTSGRNPNSVWSAASIPAIQTALVTAAQQVGIGGLILANGTNSLGGSFRSTPGIVAVDLRFDFTPNPTNAGNLQLASNQVALLEPSNVTVSFS